MAKKKKSWEEFYEEFGSIIDCAEHYAEHNQFIASVLDGCKTWNNMTERQEVALIAAFAKVQQKLMKADASFNEYFGKTREKYARDLTCVNTFSTSSVWGPYNIVIMEDADGRTFVYKGGNPSPLKNGESGLIKFTVKAHDKYQGRKQTIMARPVKINLIKVEKKVDKG